MIAEISEYFPVIVGEWCLFNSVGCGVDTHGGQSVLNGEEGAQVETLTAEQKRSLYQGVAESQLAAWSKGSGFYYWNYKLLTDTMVGVAVTDAALHEKTADFDFFDYEAGRLIPPIRPRSFRNPNPAVVRFQPAAWLIAGRIQWAKERCERCGSLAHWAEMGFGLGWSWSLNGRKRQAGRNPAQKGGETHGAGHRRANQRREPR